jgi:hypothetical protein
MIVVLMATASIVMAGAVTNTVQWNVPFGDIFRDRVIETLAAYQAEINALASGSDTAALPSNTVWIGNASGKGNYKTLYGAITITTNGQTIIGASQVSNTMIGAGAVTADKIDPAVVTNVLADGMTLPAVGGIFVTNINGTNINLGNIPVARITNSLNAAGGYILSGNISTNALTNAVSSMGGIIGGNIPVAAITNALASKIIGLPTLTAVAAGAGTNNVVGLIKNIAGGPLVTNALVRVWSSATQFGAASSNTALTTCTTGTIIKLNTTGCDYDIATTVAGAFAIHMVEADATYAITNWINVEANGYIGSVQSITAIP